MKHYPEYTERTHAQSIWEGVAVTLGILALLVIIGFAAISLTNPDLNSRGGSFDRAPQPLPLALSSAYLLEGSK